MLRHKESRALSREDSHAVKNPEKEIVPREFTVTYTPLLDHEWKCKQLRQVKGFTLTNRKEQNISDI